MRHIAIFGDNLEAFDRFGVTDYVVEVDGAVFFDPGGYSVGELVEDIHITVMGGAFTKGDHSPQRCWQSP